jgi:vancomycin aglycone glucosyltransferase
MRVLLTVSGTRGDVQPLFALARALERAGHRAVVAAPPNFATEARVLGVDFRACGLDTEAVLRANADVGRNPARVFKLAQKTARSDTLAHFETLMPLARQSDLVVSAGLMFAGSSVAEAAGVSYRYIAYTPEVLRSAHHAPPLLDLHGLPRPINRWLWSGFSKFTQWLLGGTVNGWRREAGLEPLDDVLGNAMDPEFALLAADPEVAPLAPDVALGSGALGNFWLDDTRELSPELQTFLDRGAPPVYFGFGSMPDPKPERTTSEIVDCLRSLGARGVVARGWAGLGADVDLGPDILIVDEVPHAKLFPRVAAVVHHGGAGTTAAAMLAGRPQLVIPHVMDQFGWGRRVRGLGLGPVPLPRARLNAARFRGRVADLLTNAVYAHEAQSLSARLKSRDGVRAAVRALELACAIHRAISEPPARASQHPPRASSIRAAKLDAVP